MNSFLLDDYRGVLLGQYFVLDVRAEGEFETGSVPNSVNLPILNNDERAAVGITDKQQGPDAAYDKGMQLVSGSLKSKRVQSWRDVIHQNTKVVIGCWRGGKRSEIAQEWLAESGIHAPRLAGGSKALRQYCLSVLEKLDHRNFVVVAGQTGTGKTLFLQQYKEAVDLEGLAQHRGSAFGRTGIEQPSPISFEARVASEILHTEQHAFTLLEDESRNIGRLAVPLALHAHMQKAPLIVLMKSLEERVSLTYHTYVKSQNGSELLDSLSKIRRRLGEERYQEVWRTMTDAIASDNKTLHCSWIEKLLSYYYDPQYDYQLSKKHERIRVRGDEATLKQYLEDQYCLNPK